jgi:hypothetical protein
MTLPNHWMSGERSGAIAFPFLSIQGALLPARATFERVVRPGVNGIAVWSMGTRGEPFGIMTTLDCISVAAAGAAYNAYVEAILSKKDLYYCGAYWGTVMIQEVALQGVKRFATGVGGVQGWTGGSGVILSVAWQLETLTQPLS